MNTDFKSLERRYGTLLATKLCEEIAKVEQHRFSFYKIPASLPASLKALQEHMQEEAEEIARPILSKNNKAA